MAICDKPPATRRVVLPTLASQQDGDEFFFGRTDTLQQIRGWLHACEGSAIATSGAVLSGDSETAHGQDTTGAGVLLAPGDCFGHPAHMRLGFAQQADGFDIAVGRIAEALESL